MAAEIIKGLTIANAMREDLVKEVNTLKAKGVQPKLAVVLVGDDEASKVYAQSKVKVGDKMGIEVVLFIKPANTPEPEVTALIDQLNADPNTHGILVELPLPPQIKKENVLNRILPQKDVDGVHPMNRGYLFGGQEHLALLPATPLACIKFIEHMGINLEGKVVCQVGAGETVGRPLLSMLINREATVTVTHIKTKDVKSNTKAAEIVIAAAGAPKLVKADWLSPGQMVVDVGINGLPDGGICGDVDTEAAAEVVRAITPVPGGVGSLTTTVIMQNLIKAIGLQGL